MARLKYGGEKELLKIQSIAPPLWNMAWACTAAEGSGSLIFIDDVTDGGSNRFLKCIDVPYLLGKTKQ